MVTESPAQSAALALEMGCDVNCGNTYIHMMTAYEQGLVTRDQIALAATRLFTTRYMLGILGDGCEFDGISYDAIECPAHLALAHTATEKACVLLKNDGILPLDPDALKTVAVVGPNANSRSALIGNYYGTSSRYVTVLEGIQDALEGKARVLYAQGSSLWRDKEEPLSADDDRLSEAVAVAQRSDVVFLVLGLDETLEGEEGDTGNASASGDKLDLLLPACQRALMDRILSLGKPTVVLLMAGSAIDLSRAQEKANAILLTWYPGARGGKAVADLLFGKTSPSGKLPVTFYKNEALEEMPDFTDYSMENRTYRYYTGTPLYPFGYGLSYGDVHVTGLTADTENAVVTLENRGRATEDVVQLYIRDDASSHAPTNPILGGFLRVSLEAGEVKTVTVPIDAAALTVVNDLGERIPGSGSWTLYAGTGQPDARTAELTGKTSLAAKISAP